MEYEIINAEVGGSIPITDFFFWYDGHVPNLGWKSQVIKLKNSDVTISNFQKLNNAGEIFADIITRFCMAQIKGQLNFELSGRSSPP